ncbi:hypothetical protein AB0P36_21185 [Streptomyces flavidovirens]|uniref:hypothetical protein n=1 Tax=Streptomyces flavidovirens TaxID=67298 RepID=UPI0034409B64
MANVAMTGVPLRLIGAASGTYNTIRQFGSVVGSAAVSVELQARLSQSMRSSATAVTEDLPAGSRQDFIDRISGPTGSPEGFGATPPEVPNDLQGLATQAFHNGLADAAGKTMVLLIVVLAVGVLACLAMARRSPVKRDHDHPSARPAASTEREPQHD